MAHKRTRQKKKPQRDIPGTTNDAPTYLSAHLGIAELLINNQVVSATFNESELKESLENLYGLIYDERCAEIGPEEVRVKWQTREDFLELLAGSILTHVKQRWNVASIAALAMLIAEATQSTKEEIAITRGVPERLARRLRPSATTLKGPHKILTEFIDSTLQLRGRGGKPPKCLSENSTMS